MERWIGLVLALGACGGGSRSSDVIVGDDDDVVDCSFSLSMPFVAEGATGLAERGHEDLGFEERVFTMRPLDVVAPGGAKLSIEGTAVELYDQGGALLSSGASLPGETTRLYAAGVAEGESVIVLQSTAAACGSAPVTLTLGTTSSPDLAGHGLSSFPHFEFVQAFNVEESVQTALDPHRYPDRVGLEADVYLVAHKSPAEWAADNALVAENAVVRTVVGADLPGNIVDAWLSDLPTGDGVTTGWDVVYDFGLDGTLDPGDLIDGFERPGLYSVVDLAEPGPLTPMAFQYSESFWNTMRIYTPETPTGDHPLVVISHGNGHEYDWYDYLGNHLASWGYVVISHRNDTVPGVLTAAQTTLSNTDAFILAMPTQGGGMLDGMVDTSRITWIGHSRGGEGVVIAYDWVKNGTVSPAAFSVDDIALVSSIAPTVFEGPNGANPNDVDYHLLAGSADGDVTGGVDLSDVQYFRIFLRGTGDHFVTYVQGASHNDFNCCGAMDGTWFTVQGPAPLIGRQRAQNVAKSYYLALLEYKIRGNPVLSEYFSRPPEIFHPSSVNAFVATQFMAAHDADKFVIDDFQAEPGDDLSSSGGQVSWTVSSYHEGALDDQNTRLSWDPSDPMNGMSWSDGDALPERGAVFDYDADASVSFEIVSGERDWSDARWVSLRACQGTRHPNTVALGDLLSFTVTLVDGSGVESSIDYGQVARLTEPYARDDAGQGTGWVNEFQTVRIRVADFGADGHALDLSDIATLRLDFGPSYGSARGRVGIDDLEVLR